MEIMPDSSVFPKTAAQELEIKMKKISMLISLVALALMIAGFVDALVIDHGIVIPGINALPLDKVFSEIFLSNGLSEMTIGVLLLAVLPIARILLAMWLYLRAKSLINTAVALVVLLELLFSIHAGG